MTPFIALQWVGVVGLAAVVAVFIYSYLLVVINPSKEDEETRTADDWIRTSKQKQQDKT